MISTNETQRLLEAGTAGALADAAAHLCRGLCADGPADGPGDGFAEPERQWTALLEWAGLCGKILPLTFPAPERTGGREHDVTAHEPSGRWIKYTKPGLCGYTVSWQDDGSPYMHNALPLEYLQRLIWQNEVFGDDIHLLGLWQAAPHRWRIVTSQPGIRGERATLAEIEAAFRSVGFSVMPWRGIGYEGSLSLRAGNFDIWDVHPANVLLAPDGLPLPIDVIVTRTPPDTPHPHPSPL